MAHNSAAEVVELAKGLAKQNADLAEEQKILRRELAEVKEKAVAQYPGGAVPGALGGPYAQIGRSAGDNESYSFLKVAGLMTGILTKEQCKYEWDVHQKLCDVYAEHRWYPENYRGFGNFIAPFATRLLPTTNSKSERLVGELRHKMAPVGAVADEDEARWMYRKMGYREKDLGTISESQGGVLVGFPTLMELIDIQRNIEVFSQAGATEQALPANGRMQYPKLTNVTSANWVGEAATITESTPGTGALDLQAKKLAILVDLNNELIRFGSITAEAMVRGDMAKVAALKADLGMLEGTGGTQIKGLITYDSAATWTTGQDKLLAYTVTSNKIQVSDAADMEAIMPDTTGEPTAWIMRRQLWAKIQNRRASAAITTDSQGPFLVDMMRPVGKDQPLSWFGKKVVRSTQVSATRGSGAQTYVILGYFPDWIIARFGVLQFLSSMVGDTQMTNDQTRLRCIQHIDAGPRHASSFVFADAIDIS